MQCMAGAMTATAAATGTRAWLVARAPAWLTPGRRRTATRALIALGVLGSGVIGPTAV